MRFVTSGPNEYLIVGRRGRTLNHGTAASVLAWPGATYVRVPSTNQEARFEMTQETRDGIPLRFKGIVIYRIVDPVIAAGLFDFQAPQRDDIRTLIAHICLGELRATAAHLSMAECIEQRKTTLTDAVAAALRTVVMQKGGWGIELDVVQVAQVYIVDDELRRRLESGVRNELASRSTRSEIQMGEEIKIAQQLSDRRVQEQGIENERQRIAFQQEKVRLQRQLQQAETEERIAFEQEKGRLERQLQKAQIEDEAPIQLLKIERQRGVLQEEIALRKLENEVKALAAEGEAIPERLRQGLRRDMLALEQVPAISEALAKVFQGAQLTVYGAEAEVFAPVAMLLDLLAARLRPVAPAGGQGASS